MTEAEAREELEMLVEWEADPPLSALEVDFLLRLSRVEDSGGLGPTDPEWAGAWDVRGAAARGWRMKAGKAAARFDLTTDVTSLSRSQVQQQCLQMAQVYDRPQVA